MRAVNLIPREQRSGDGSLLGSSGGGALIVLGLIVGVAVLALMYGGADRQIAKESGEVAKVEAQTSEVRARVGSLAPYSSFVSMAEQRTKTVAQLVQARFDWSHTLHELGRVLPSSSKLLALSGTVGSASLAPGAPPASASASSASSGATPASSTPPGSVPTLSLSGCSVSQAEAAQTLQRLKLMDGVTSVHLQSSVETGDGASSGGSSGSCPSGGVAFSMMVTFAALPSTPIPNVASTTPPSTPVSSASAKGAQAEAVSTRAKGAQR